MRKYSKYKNSGIDWIGEIPEKWSVKRIKNIGNLYSGISGKAGNDFNNEANPNNKKFINFTNIANNLYINSSDLGLVEIKPDENQNTVKKGDLLFLMSSENQEDVGKSATLRNDYGELYLNSFCKGLRLIDKNIDASFLNYLLSSNALKRLLSIEGRGFTRINLRQDSILSLPVIVPSLEEQTQIATYLDYKTNQIETLIANKQKLIELLQEERTAIINQAVTKGINPKVKLKPSGIDWLGDVPENWEVKRLKYVKADEKNAFVDGPFGSNLKTEHFIENGDVYVIDSGYVTSGEFEFHRDFKTITKEHFETVKRSQCTENDIIISKIGANFGMSGILPKLDKPSLVSGNTLKLTINRNKYNLEFIHLQLLNLKEFGEIDILVKGSAQPALSMGAMSDLPFFIPKDLKEQDEIVDFIKEQKRKIDKTIIATQKEIELLKEYKTALISEVVTGKVDVRDEVVK